MVIAMGLAMGDAAAFHGERARGAALRRKDSLHMSAPQDERPPRRRQPLGFGTQYMKVRPSLS